MIAPHPKKLLFAGAASLLTVLALPLLGGAAGAATGTPVNAGGALTVSTGSLDFGPLTVGDISATDNVTVTNTSDAAVTITSIDIGGADDFDFVESDDCGTLAAAATCTVQVNFVPGALGARAATLTPDDGSGADPVVALTGSGTEGYYEFTAKGGTATYGDATNLGGLTSTPLIQPIVASAATGDDQGYWLAAADGGVFTFGDAGYYGSTGSVHLNKPIVGMASTLDFGGYWLVASDGGVFAFGDANFYGSTGNRTLNDPIVGIAPTPDDGGYWLVASDGGIFTFGDAGYYGSTGAIKLNKPIVGMASTPDGGGYWLMASDGGIFAFGDAPFYGSASGTSTSPYVTIAGDAPPTEQAILDEPAARRAAIDAHRAQ